MQKLLETIVPDERILADTRQILSEIDYEVNLRAGLTRIPQDSEHAIVARTCCAYYFEIGFGSHFQVVVAVGGVASVEFGIVEAGICFFRLWYSAGGELITNDIFEDPP
ncbi:MAG: hypothetical protein AAGF23_26215 [Acidobacteriota bacterium]